MNNYSKEISTYFELKGSPDSSRESYQRRIDAFIKYMESANKSVEDATEKDIQEYILYLKKVKGLSAGTINNYISGIKFFYRYVFDKEWSSTKIPRMKSKRKMPVILPKQDIMLILKQCTNLKHRAILALMYSSGLRVSEVAKLKISDINSKSMQVRIDDAKHETNRYSILSNTALKVLREYFKEYFKTGYTPDGWLFPGANHGEHINVKSIKNTVIKLCNKLCLDPKISAHTMRHCFATHSLEDGVDPVFIQQMLGHKSIQTTLQYLHMTSKSLMGIKSPLDTYGGNR